MARVRARRVGADAHLVAQLRRVVGHRARALDDGLLDGAHTRHLGLGRCARPQAPAATRHARRPRRGGARRRIARRGVAAHELRARLWKCRAGAAGHDDLLLRSHRGVVRRRRGAQARCRRARRGGAAGAAAAHAQGRAGERTARLPGDAAPAALPVQLARRGARAGARGAGHRRAHAAPARRAAPLRRARRRADGDARAGARRAGAVSRDPAAALRRLAHHLRGRRRRRRCA